VKIRLLDDATDLELRAHVSTFESGQRFVRDWAVPDLARCPVCAQVPSLWVTGRFDDMHGTPFRAWCCNAVIGERVDTED
jgi:hypothetical protein